MLLPIELPAANLAPYSPAQVRFAAAAWPMRAAEELRSAMVFRAIGCAARICNVPLRWRARFGHAVRDEVRHARLCAMVGKRLGAPSPQYDASPVHARLVALAEPQHRMLTLLLVEIAVGETISASLFRAGRRTTVEPLSRAVLTAIVADEVRHRDLGWAAAAELLREVTSARDHRALFHAVATGLARCEEKTARPALLRLEGGETFDPALAALGTLSPEARVEAFYSAVEQVVVPRLEKVGLDGARAWKERYRQRPQQRGSEHF